MFATRPAAITLAARVDIHGGAMIVMKRADALERGAHGAQLEIAADDIDDVVCFFDLLLQCCPIVSHGAPACSRPFTRLENGSANVRACGVSRRIENVL